MLYTQREGIFESLQYYQADVARQHEAFYAPDYVPDAADHIGMAQTTIDRFEQINFDVVAPILHGSRISSRCFMNTATRMILECPVLP